MKSFKLDFSNRIIEHLGVKLYQNKPTNVIAEFLSNAWDADSENVNIDLKAGSDGTQCILITDDGLGMSRDELTDNFLIIGRNRRTSPTEKSARGRGYMGRKGIGKLAGFGIANIVDILSAPNSKRRGDASNPVVFWLRFSLRDIIKQHGNSGSYLPEVLADGVSITDLAPIIEKNGNGETFDSFIKNATTGSGGVCIRLSETTIKRCINPQTLLHSMGRRFTVTMLRPDFNVRINSMSITPEAALPPLQDFSIGSRENPITELIDINGTSREVKYWISFVKLQDSDWSIENAGIGIYSHGKIAQDRPFFFEVKGKEILSRYMYGVIEADWLDELPYDVVSTDRRSIDWSTDETLKFHEWGANKITVWLSSYKKWRDNLPKIEIIDKIRKQNTKLTAKEEEALAELLSEVFTDLGNNEEAKNKTAEKITSAWTHAPTRQLTQNIWKKVFSGDLVTPDVFTNLVEELRISLVPEAMGLAVTMAQRIAAITALNQKISSDKTETHLQRLIEQFPWLIDPKNEFLTANQTIRTLVNTKHKPDAERGQWSLSASDGNLKPDFVFLSDPGSQIEIVVYELKGPECQKTLQPVEYEQLNQYLNIIKGVHTNTKIRGVLIGHETGGFEEYDKRITVRKWADVLLDARLLHVSYLEALLRASEPDANDTRMKQISDFGGKETKELLSRYSNSISYSKEILEELPTSS
jgi:hypothetical protein